MVKASAVVSRSRYIPWTIERLIDVNGHFRKDPGPRGLRVKEGDLIPTLLSNLLENYNAQVSEDPEREELSKVFANFWIKFVLVIRPFDEDDAKTAKFVLRSEIQRRGFHLFNVNLFDEFKPSNDLDSDQLRLTKIFDENIVSLKEDLGPLG